MFDTESSSIGLQSGEFSMQSLGERSISNRFFYKYLPGLHAESGACKNLI